MEEINRLFLATPFLDSTGIDERYRLHLIEEYAKIGEPNQDEIHMGRAIIRIKHFRRWLKDAYLENIVSGFKTGDGNLEL